jgi:glutamine synthetase
VRQALETISHAGVRQVRVVTPDLHGIARAKAITADRFAEICERGITWAAPLLAVDLWQNMAEGSGYHAAENSGNCLLVPDCTTLRVLPWAPESAVVIAQPCFADGSPADSPRHACAQVMARAAAQGLHPTTGHELEFYVHRPGAPTFDPPTEMRAWFTDQALEASRALVDDWFKALSGLGVGVYEIFNEHGAGQFEVNIRPGRGLAAVDEAFLARIAIRDVALQHGLATSFIAQPANRLDTPPSGYHLHQSLLDEEGRSVLADPSRPHGLSSAGEAYLAGQLDHAAALTAFAAPTVTGYKRFIPGTWAPVRIAWGTDNRAGLIRLVTTLTGPEGALHFELRLGEAGANPYLYSAAAVAAGLDGVARRLKAPPPQGGDIALEAGLPRVPGSLVEALQALEADEALREGVGLGISQAFLAMARQVWGRYQAWVTDWELREYLEVL